MIPDKRTWKTATSTSPEEHRSSSMSRKENNRKSSGSTRVTAVGAEQPTDRVKTIHPDIEPPKRDVVGDSTTKDREFFSTSARILFSSNEILIRSAEASELVENLKSIDIKTSTANDSDIIPEDLESIKQRRRRGKFIK